MNTLKINSKTLKEALTDLALVINPNHMIPIQQYVKMELQDGLLTLTGDNLETRLVLKIKDIQESDDFNICVDFALLHNATKSIPDQDLNISITHSDFKITHKNGDFTIPIDSSSEFTNPPLNDLNSKAQTKGIKLKNSLKVASKFLDKNTASITSYISLSIDKNLYVRSTNKACLYEERIKAKGDSQNMLLSNTSASSLSQLLSDDKITMLYNSNLLLIKDETKEIMVVLQSGNYPINGFKTLSDSVNNGTVLKTDYNQLHNSFKRVSSLSFKEKLKTVKIDIENNNIKLNCYNELSESNASEMLDCEYNEAYESAFNPAYLIEMMNVFTEHDEIKINESKAFGFQSKNKVGLIAPRQL